MGACNLESYVSEWTWVTRSVMSDSSRSHGLEPARLLCLWNSPGKNTGVGGYSLLQGIFPNQTSVSDTEDRFFTIWAIHIGTSNNNFWRHKYYAKINNKNWKQQCKHIPDYLTYWYSLLKMSAQFNYSFLSTSCTYNTRLGKYLPKSIPGAQSMW